MGSVRGLGLKAQDVEALVTHLEHTLVLSVNAPPFQPHQEEWEGSSAQWLVTCLPGDRAKA